MPFCRRTGGGPLPNAPKLLPQTGVSVEGLIPVGLPGSPRHPLSRAARSSSPSTAKEVFPV